MKTVLFVPGFREDLGSRDFKRTIDAIESKGYRVKFVPINWKRTTIGDWIKELDEMYESYDPQQTVLAGFSFGAMTAFMAATKRNPSELCLFSLSPYFADDIAVMPKSWLTDIGHRRADAFRQLNFNQLAKDIRCKTLLFVSENEAKKYPIIGQRSELASKAIASSTLTVIPKSGHNVTESNYVAAIKEAIGF